MPVIIIDDLVDFSDATEPEMLEFWKGHVKLQIQTVNKN